jgi:hypothetical protein
LLPLAVLAARSSWGCGHDDHRSSSDRRLRVCGIMAHELFGAVFL